MRECEPCGVVGKLVYHREMFSMVLGSIPVHVRANIFDL